MKNTLKLITLVFLLSCMLLTACVNDASKLSGITINDMLMPEVSESTADENETVPTGSVAPEVTQTPDPNQSEVDFASKAIKEFSLPSSHKITVDVGYNQKYDNGENKFSVIVTSKGIIKMKSDIPSKMYLNMLTESEFEADTVKKEINLYIEQEADDTWWAYSDDSGGWAAAEMDAEKISNLSVNQANWDKLISGLEECKFVKIGDIDGSPGVEVQANVPTKTVDDVFGPELDYIIPGLVAMSEDSIKDIEDMPISVWLDQNGKVQKLQIDATAALSSVVTGAFKPTESDVFDVSIEDMSIIITIDEFDKEQTIEIPQAALDAVEEQ